MIEQQLSADRRPAQCAGPKWRWLRLAKRHGRLERLAPLVPEGADPPIALERYRHAQGSVLIALCQQKCERLAHIRSHAVQANDCRMLSLAMQAGNQRFRQLQEPRGMPATQRDFVARFVELLEREVTNR